MVCYEIIYYELESKRDEDKTDRFRNETKQKQEPLLLSIARNLQKCGCVLVCLDGAAE